MSTQKRPLIISVICILFIVYSIVSMIFSYKTISNNSVPYWDLLLSLTIHIVGFIAIAGIWAMRKWGVFLYLILTIIIQIEMSLLNNWSAYLLITPFIIISTILLFYKRFK